MLRRRRPVKQLVKLHTVTDQTFEGVLVGVDGGHYRLAAAKVERGGELQTVTGELYVPAERVLFLQTVVRVATA